MNEVLGGAVHAGRFRGVELDAAVVDMEPVESGEDMFDEADADRRLAERGAAIGAGDVVDLGGDRGVRAQVGAHEDDSG